MMQHFSMTSSFWPLVSTKKHSLRLVVNGSCFIFKILLFVGIAGQPEATSHRLDAQPSKPQSQRSSTTPRSGDRGRNEAAKAGKEKQEKTCLPPPKKIQANNTPQRSSKVFKSAKQYLNLGNSRAKPTPQKSVQPKNKQNMFLPFSPTPPLFFFKRVTPGNSNTGDPLRPLTSRVLR